MNKHKLTQAEIDEIVIAEASDLEQWEEPNFVQPAASTTLTIPVELAVRARFFAKLHKKSSMEEWLQAIVQERITFEETAYATLKQSITR